MDGGGVEWRLLGRDGGCVALQGAGWSLLRLHLRCAQAAEWGRWFNMKAFDES